MKEITNDKKTTEYIKTIRHIMALSLDTMTDEEINNCEEIIKLIKEQPRWIPCSECIEQGNQAMILATFRDKDCEELYKEFLQENCIQRDMRNIFVEVQDDE